MNKRNTEYNQYAMEELIPIVAELAEGYTSKESTSIPYDAAKQLMGAVIYCMNEFYESDDLQDYIITTEQGQRLPAKQCYNRGYELVLQKVKKAKLVYEETIKDFNSYRSQCYQDTVIKGLPHFFRYYDARYHPQNHILTLDYPTIKSSYNLNGIDAIYHFISCVQLEQIFLSALPEAYIHEVLCAYHNDYEELLENICSILLRNLLGGMLSGKKITQKGYTEAQYKEIKAYVEQNSREEVENKIVSLIEILVKEAYGNNQRLKDYLMEDVKNFVPLLINAAKNNCLGAVFVI